MRAQPTTGETEAGNFEEWFCEHVPSVLPPFDIERIGGGRSNLTFRVTDQNGRSWVFRRPPLGLVLSTAHDMRREWRAISALARTDVPVPEPVAVCEDPEVLGAPFYVMGFVEGSVLRNASLASRHLPLSARRACAGSLCDVLARLHALDIEATGLAGHGRSEGYVRRQLRRWHGQWNDSKIREFPLLQQLYEMLSESVPAQDVVTIVHGDYRLDNTIVDDEGAVLAVLDWELSTLGDPMADLASLIVHWDEPDSPTQAQGFPSSEAAIDMYASISGRDMKDIDFHLSFCHWKLACILEGVYARYQAKVMGDDDLDPVQFALASDRHAQASREILLAR